MSLATETYGSRETSGGALCAYARASMLETRDLNGTLIASTSSSVAVDGVDEYCNVTDVSETASTSDGASFTTRTVTNYLNNPTTWLIGLPTRVAVTKTAIQPYAAANPPALTLSNCNSSTPTTSAATMTCVLGNAGQATASGIVYGTGSGASSSGPISCAGGNTNCGTVTVLTPATPGNYGGALTATPAFGSAASAAYSLAVYTSPMLTLASCISSSPTTAAATMSCNIGNSGQTAANGITYIVEPGAIAVGPSECAAGASNCGLVTVTSAANPDTYAGTLIASPANGGSSASAVYSLVVFTPPAMRFAGCSATAPSTAVQRLTCNLANDGQADASVGF